MEEKKRSSQKDGENDRAEARKSPGHRGEEGSSSSTENRGGESGASRGTSEKRSTSTKKK